MTDSLTENAQNPESFEILANIAQVLENDPDNGLEKVQGAFTAEFERAQKAVAEEATDLDELKRVRLAFTGDKSAFTLANKQMRSLSKEHKAEVGKLMGQARGRLNKVLEGRTAELEAEREARILVEEAVDVTATSGRRHAGARHLLVSCAARLANRGP